MTAKIINFADFRKTPASAPTAAAAHPSELGPWVCSMEIYGPVFGSNDSSVILKDFDDQDGLQPGDRLRAIADHLESIVATLRDIAHDTAPTRDGRIVARVTVYESSRANLWIRNDVATEEQYLWVERCIDDAKTVVRPTGNGQA